MGSYVHNCTGAGITIYHSTVDLEKNSSNHNDYGLLVYDRSNVSVLGNKYAEYVGETQRFTDNSSYEFYCSRSSFPHTFRWNAIRDEDNTEPMIYVSGTEGVYDVRYNYWGNNFDPVEDLYPWTSFIYEPVWTLMNDDSNEDGPESLYFASTQAEADSNYILAHTGYMQLIDNYPESRYSKAAMKRLYSIESYINNDYAVFKNYLLTEPNIINNPELDELAGFLVNFCEIKLENWPTAIAWFENIIQNPESLEDSIFAIIDLGYTYFLMEQGGYKNAYSGTMAEHIPVSAEQFDKKKDFLLDQLPNDQLSKTMKENITTLNEGELLQNVPNPFKGKTQIWYKLETEAAVQLNVYNYTGHLISSINEGTKTKGSHYVDFDATGLKNGIYFYSIIINGQTTDSKKMTILK
ncbi:MAG: T9SS type A sorting domain-containing protein [Bacteroidales bacterium]